MILTFLPVRLSVVLLSQSRGFEDGVHGLGVSDGGVVSDARVGADEGVGADLGVVVDDGGASHGGPAVDYGASARGFSGSRVMTPASMAAMSAFFSWNGPCFCME